MIYRLILASEIEGRMQALLVAVCGNGWSGKAAVELHEAMQTQLQALQDEPETNKEPEPQTTLDKEELMRILQAT